MSRKTFMLIVCAYLSLLHSPVLSNNFYEKASLAQSNKKELKIDARRNITLDEIVNNQAGISNKIKELPNILSIKNLNEETERESSTQVTAQIDDNANDDASELTRLLNEVLKKQADLETAFQKILESSENNSTAKFIQDQLVELHNLVQSEKSKCGGDIKSDAKELQLHDEHLNCLHNCSGTQSIYKDCRTAVTSNGNNEGAYLMSIRRSSLPPFYAYCVIEDEKPWMIIQRREDGSENFYRNWQDYKAGFGNVEGEYWLGLERLHTITKDKPHELLIVMEDYLEIQTYARYTQFSIGSEETGFKLKATFLKGNSTFDALFPLNGIKFSTYDSNNSYSNINCARKYQAAWWYNARCQSNLNGRYFAFSERLKPYGINWIDGEASLYKVYMAIRHFDVYDYQNTYRNYG